MDNKTVTACARAFCETVKGYGFKPMIYAYTRDLYFTYDLSELSDYAIWLREYNEVPTCYYSFDMWQYAREVTLDGIENTVDLNLYFVKENTPRVTVIPSKRAKRQENAVKQCMGIQSKYPKQPHKNAENARNNTPEALKLR